MIAVSCSCVSRESRLRRDRKGHRVLYTSRLQHRMVHSEQLQWKRWERQLQKRALASQDFWPSWVSSFYKQSGCTLLPHIFDKLNARIFKAGSLSNLPPVHRSVGIPVLGNFEHENAMCHLVYDCDIASESQYDTPSERCKQ